MEATGPETGVSSSGILSGAPESEDGEGFRDDRLLGVGRSEASLDGTAVFVVGTTDGLPVLAAGGGGGILGAMVGRRDSAAWPRMGVSHKLKRTRRGADCVQ